MLERNEPGHAKCQRCRGLAYAEVLLTGIVVLRCERRSCGASVPVGRRSAPALPRLVATKAEVRRVRKHG